MWPLDETVRLLLVPHTLLLLEQSAGINGLKEAFVELPSEPFRELNPMIQAFDLSLRCRVFRSQQTPAVKQKIAGHAGILIAIN